MPTYVQSLLIVDVFIGVAGYWLIITSVTTTHHHPELYHAGQPLTKFWLGVFGEFAHLPVCSHIKSNGIFNCNILENK